MCLATIGLALAIAPTPAPAADKDETAKVLEQYKPNIDKGIKWLAEQQQKDGHWEGAGGAFRLPMTAFAGLALLSEGSTTKDGKYNDQLLRAVDWTLSCAQESGLLHNVNDKGESGRYMMSHGYAMLFLSQVYAMETDEKRHKAIGKVLEKAVDYAQKAQTSKGGWGYVSAKDGNDFDEGCATEIVLHGLFACRKAGIAVPKELVKSSLAYLEKSNKVVKDDKEDSKKQAGVLYSLAQGNVGEARPALTVAAVALMLSAGETDNKILVPWLNYAQTALPFAALNQNPSGGHEFIQFYMAQACFQLGDEGHAKLRPDLAERAKEKKSADELLTWSRYREVMFKNITAIQEENGSWKSTQIGDVYPTALYLVVLQLDKGHLPYFKR
jgi:hypothetical protein